MQFFASILSLAAVTAATAAMGRVRQVSSATPDFCTEATYPEGDPHGEPYGAGWCAGLEAEVGACYIWASFPASEDGPLVGNLTCVFIPGTYQCDLYKTDDCTGDSYGTQDGDNDLSNSMFGPTSFNKEVESWACVSL